VQCFFFFEVFGCLISWLIDFRTIWGSLIHELEGLILCYLPSIFLNIYIFLAVSCSGFFFGDCF
jgi:hypothetical protein